MSFTSINIGTTANDGTGTKARAGGTIINDNFTGIVSPGAPIMQIPCDHSLDYAYGKGTTTFARSSAANVIDNYGTSVAYASGAPRLVANKGILVESASTNLVTYSEQFDHANWTKAANVTITPDDRAAPDGNTTADKYNISSTSNRDVKQNYTVDPASKTYTASLWVYPTSNTTITLHLLRDGSSVGSSAIAVTASSWQRIQHTVTYDATSGTTVGMMFEDTSGSTGDRCHVWGAQLEERTYASSYILTTTAAATRAVETLTMVKANNTNDDGAFSVTAYVTIDKVLSTDQVIFDIRDATLGHTLFVNASGYLSLYFGSGTITSTLLLTAGTQHRVGYTHDGSGNVVLYRDSSSYSSNGTIAAPNGDNANLSIGHGLANDKQLNGYVRDLRFYHKQLSAIQLYMGL